MAFSMPDMDDYYGRITAIQTILVPGSIALESFEIGAEIYPFWVMDIDQIEEITFDSGHGNKREFTLPIQFTMFLIRAASEGVLTPHALSKQIARDVIQVMVGWVDYMNLIIPTSTNTDYHSQQTGFVSDSTTITTQGSVEIRTPLGPVRGSQFTLTFQHVVEREVIR